MTRKRRAGHLRRLGRLAHDAGRSALAGAELSTAAGRVIARRVALGVSALAAPGTADHAEFARMVPEKVEALTAASIAVTRLCAATMAENARRSAREATLASSALMNIALCRSPAALMALQNRLMSQWFTGGYSHSVALLTTGMKFQHALLTPFHTAATGNAKRLGRSR